MELRHRTPLEDELVVLRPWRDEDVPAIVAACNDPEIVALDRPCRRRTPQRDARAWLARCADGLERGSCAARGRRAGSGELAAAITLWLHGKVGELGYWAAPESRPRTTCRVRCGSSARWAFDELELPRMQLGTFPGNIASERVAEKSGFTREGVLRAWLEQRGERRDVTMWSLPTRRSRVAPRAGARAAGG